MIRGIVFDLDSTLADSKLDFDLMRSEMGLPTGLPILETLNRLDPAEATRCRAILDRHEQDGVDRATLLPGARELIEILASRGMHLAVATRNSRPITQATLRKLGVEIELLLTRCDGPVKPDPWPLLHICRRWQISPAEVIAVGDHRFDIDCGRAAGCRTVLLTHAPQPEQYANTERADLVLSSLAEYPRLIAWLETL